jgi:hypothetical protein
MRPAFAGMTIHKTLSWIPDATTLIGKPDFLQEKDIKMAYCVQCNIQQILKKKL